MQIIFDFQVFIGFLLFSQPPALYFLLFSASM